jgi:hypothetical protein
MGAKFDASPRTTGPFALDDLGVSCSLGKRPPGFNSPLTREWCELVVRPEFADVQRT